MIVKKNEINYIMKSKIRILVLFFLSQICYSQTLIRVALKGKVENQSINLDNGIVFNKNSKNAVFLDQQGAFVIQAKVNDTLMVSSLSYKSKQIILTENDFSTPVLRIKLDGHSLQLEEIVIVAKKGIHPINGNTQSIVDTPFVDDEKSSPKNNVMPPDGTIEYGIDFVRIYKDVFKTLKKNYPEKTDFVSDKGFTEVALQKVGYDFFINSLKLNDHEVRLFLLFCENDPKSKTLLSPESEFELMDFLFFKNKEFKRITVFEK